MQVYDSNNINSSAVAAHRLLRDAKVQKLLEIRRADIRRRFALTTDRVMLELARVSYYNPRRLVDEHGRALPLHKLDEDTAAALAHFEVTETQVTGKGKDKAVVTRTTRARPFNKPQALNQAIKVLHLYEKPPPPPPDENERPVDARETARRMVFLLTRGARAPAAAATKAKGKKRSTTEA